MPSPALIVLLLTVALPLLEIALLIKVGAIIGVWPTLAIIVATAIAGFTVVRHQGLGVVRRMRVAMQSGEPPVEPMLEGMLLMFAGACLIAPGLITDTIGFVLLVPPVRQYAARLILRRRLFETVEVRSRRRRGGGPRRDDGRPGADRPAPTIEGDYERIDEKPAQPGTPPRVPPL